MTNITFISLIDVVFVTQCASNITFLSRIDEVFENGMRDKYYIYSISLIHAQGTHTNGVTGDCLQNLKHLYGNIIRFVL